MFSTSTFRRAADHIEHHVSDETFELDLLSYLLSATLEHMPQRDACENVTLCAVALHCAAHGDEFARKLIEHHKPRSIKARDLRIGDKLIVSTVAGERVRSVRGLLLDTDNGSVRNPLMITFESFDGEVHVSLDDMVEVVDEEVAQ